MTKPERPMQLAFRPEQVALTAWIAPQAVVLGDVTVGAESSVWFQSVVRGDTERVVIGARCNIQDGCVLHADPGFPCVLEDEITVGHGAIVHGATVGAGSLIGIRATVLNGAKIGPRCLIGAGALVPEGMEIPPDSVVLGMPGKVVRSTTPADQARMQRAIQHYVEATAAYRQAETAPPARGRGE